MSSLSKAPVLLKKSGGKFLRQRFPPTINKLLKQATGKSPAKKLKVRRLISRIKACQEGKFLPRTEIEATPTAVATPPPPTPTQAPTATPSPTSTPVDICSSNNKQFFWNVQSVAPQGPFDLSAAPHIQVGKIALINMSWFGALPNIVDDTLSHRDRINWLQLPSTTRDGRIYVNSGTPLYSDLAAHEAAIRRHISSYVPDPEFDGYIVFDWEEWSPLWDLSTSWRLDLRDEALAQYSAQNPGLAPEQIQAGAKQRWYEAGLQLFLQTVLITRELRPRAKLSWYELVPVVYWNGYASTRGDLLRAENDSLLSIHQALDTIIVGIYQFYRSGVDTNGIPIPYPTGGGYPPNGTVYFERNLQYVKENIEEAKRIAALSGGNPVMAYAWHRYHDSGNLTDRFHLTNAADLYLQTIYPLQLGADMVTLWGYEGAGYQSGPQGYLQPYIDTVIGPMVEGYCRNNLGQFSGIAAAAANPPQ
ncbi:MAG: hypothetical protein EBZ48_07465 [Proteobacteria bacterium]|nr:hypothetical protein [Pseudomonadota bacterium]